MCAAWDGATLELNRATRHLIEHSFEFAKLSIVAGVYDYLSGRHFFFFAFVGSVFGLLLEEHRLPFSFFT